MSNVNGEVMEVAKTKKAWKCKIGGKSFYCNKDINHLVGRVIEADYVLSDPYPNPAKPGETVQSKYITAESIKIQAVDTTPSAVMAAKIEAQGHKTPLVEHGQGATDWDSKEKRSIRGMCISYSKDLVLGGKIEVAELENMATSMVNYIYEKEKEIPF